MQTPRSNGLTRASVADDVLLQRLLESAGRAGDRNRLPPERELAGLLEVSRPTVRDRLSLLEGIGALQRRTGAGTFVRRLDPADLAGILQLAGLVGTFAGGGLPPVLIAVEAEAAAVAAEQRAAEGLAGLVAEHGGVREAAALAGFDKLFRTALVQAAGDDSLTFFHNSLTLAIDSERLWCGRRLASDPEWAWAEYRTLAAAVAAGDAATAAAVTRRHARWLAGEPEDG